MITAETPGEETGKPKNWQLRAKILLRVATALAVVAIGTTIGWLNSYAPLAKDWSIIANVATAVGTLGLALFAVLAWRLQIKNLAKMEDQIRTSENRVIEERQQAYLVDYMLSLKKMADSATDSKVDTAKLAGKTVDAWMVWSMDMLRENLEMRAVTSAYNRLLSLEACDINETMSRFDASIEQSEQMTDRDGDECARLVTDFADKYLPNVRKYLSIIQEWQMNPSLREEISANLMATITEAQLQSDNSV